jgi:hypothetical protein
VAVAVVAVMVVDVTVVVVDVAVVDVAVVDVAVVDVMVVAVDVVDVAVVDVAVVVVVDVGASIEKESSTSRRLRSLNPTGLMYAKMRISVALIMAALVTPVVENVTANIPDCSVRTV